ncbi:MAG: FAD-binding domain-containing protein [Pseudomonadota bacterium]
MSPLAQFPPTRAAALSRITAVRPADYARTRNAIDGAVTRLSPYITHGLVSLPEVLAGVASRHAMEVQHKFVYELGWREYFHHVWKHRGNDILQSLHPGPLPESVYATDLPVDIRHACTGVPVIDQAVRALYATGYLHNHARMWLASYVVHLRKVHWRTGADWMLAHLLDGDLASNHLSWQWVAGTGSRKPYLFNAENVARYAPPQWHSPGSVIDTSYEALDAIARDARPVPATPSGEGVEEPALASSALGPPTLASTEVAGRDVWLVHPFALGEPPIDLAPDGLRIAWWPSEYHDAWPWNASRWAFVAARMAELAPLAGHGTRLDLSQALAGARSVQTMRDPHVQALLPRDVQQRTPQHLFADVDRPCASFSAWWNIATRGVKQLGELPGFAQPPYSHSIVAGGLPEMS